MTIRKLWWPCCKKGCPSFLDEFDRANSTDVGPNWAEGSDPAGTEWDIYNDTLRELGTSGAQCICTQNPQGEKISFWVWATIDSPASNRVYRVVVNWFTNAAYHYAELDLAARKLRICKNLAGERTLLDEVDCNPPLTADIDLYVCFEPQQFFAYVGNVTNPAWIVDPIEVEGGYWAGVENGCVYPIRFERFKVSEHFATNQRCPKCSCYCDTNAVPKLLTLTIVKTKAGWLSDWLDTKTVQLAFNPTYGFWVGELLPTPLDIPDCPPGETSELTFCLQCPSKLPDPTLADDFSLTVCCTFRYPAPNCDINRFRATHTSTKSSTCEPLFFYFGPKDLGYCSGSGWQVYAGEIRYEVSESP